MNLFHLNLLITFLTTWTLIYLSLPFFRKFFPDKPNSRSSHSKIKPTGGGIIFVLTSSINFIINSNYIFSATTLLGLLGLLDDKKNLSSFLRFVLQFIFVNFLISQSDIIKLLFRENFLLVNLIIWFFINLVGIGLINFINFMDGIDGLVCGSMIFVVYSSGIILNQNFYGLIFSLLAFLFWNWSPSKIFMGDAGSTFLGGFLVCSMTNAFTLEDSALIFISCSPLWMDAFITLFRRLISKQKIFNSHKLHIYQRLNQNGFSHSVVSLIYILWSLVFSLACTSKDWKLIFAVLISLIIFGLYIERNHTKPFLN